MIDNEKYQKELIHMWDSVRDDRFKGHDECDGVICKVCPIYEAEYDNYHLYNDVYNAVERWASNHPPKKFKVSQLEYDILKAFSECGFDNFHWLDKDKLLMSLLRKGYFKGATKDMSIKDYLDNCEVTDNV